MDLDQCFRDITASAVRAGQLVTLAHVYNWALSGSREMGAAQARYQIANDILPQTRIATPVPTNGRPPGTFQPTDAIGSLQAFYRDRTPQGDITEIVLRWLLQSTFDDANNVPGGGTQTRCRAICQLYNVKGNPPSTDARDSIGETIDEAWLLRPLPPLIGREDDLDRHVGRLARAIESQRPLIIEGPTGVGKSLFLRHLLHRAVTRWRTPSPLASAKFTLYRPAHFLDPTRRERFLAVAATIRENPEFVPVFDGLEVFLNPAANLAELFAEAFGGLLAASGRAILLVGRSGAARQSELVSGVPVAPLSPLSRESTESAIRVRLTELGQRENLRLADPDVFTNQLLDLAAQRYPGRFFPEVALHLAESAASRAVNRTLYLGQEPLGELTEDDLWQHVAEEQGLFAELQGRNASEFYTAVKRGLKEDVRGQDHAADTVIDWLSGQVGRPPRREPRGRFLLSGPPGVGKTAFARSLARRLGYGEEAFFTFNMAEYGTDSARTRFLGADPGYVGYRGTRTLFDLVKRRPSCVVLLDEVDRADSSLQDILLGILEGEGKDSEGESVYFSQAVFLMTTNLGQEAVEQAYLRAAEKGVMRTELVSTFGNRQLRPLILAGVTAPAEDAMRRYLDEQIERMRSSFDPKNEESLGTVASFVQLRELRRRLELTRRTSPIDRAFLDRIEAVIPFFPLREPGLRQELLDLHLTRAGWTDCPPEIRELILRELEDITPKDDPAGPSVRAMQQLIGEYQCRTPARKSEDAHD